VPFPLVPEVPADPLVPELPDVPCEPEVPAEPLVPLEPEVPDVPAVPLEPTQRPRSLRSRYVSLYVTAPDAAQKAMV
jgi:hypothetical protein